MRIDEALRIYLSEFRLPGEAPLISALLEHFAAHWRVRDSTNFYIVFRDVRCRFAEHRQTPAVSSVHTDRSPTPTAPRHR